MVKFRDYLASSDYNADELEKLLMSRKVEDPIKRYIKWGVITFVGIKNVIAGVLGLADQVKGSIKDWNPELFLI